MRFSMRFFWLAFVLVLGCGPWGWGCAASRTISIRVINHCGHTIVCTWRPEQCTDAAGAGDYHFTLARGVPSPVSQLGRREKGRYCNERDTVWYLECRGSPAVGGIVSARVARRPVYGLWRITDVLGGTTGRVKFGTPWVSIIYACGEHGDVKPVAGKRTRNLQAR